VTGERAYQLGFATRLVARDILAIETERLAERIAANAPLSVQQMKRVVRRTVRSAGPMEDAELEAARVLVSRSEDVQEGLAAFLERRAPVFRGL
jgi:enoyl-CoA hydratase/carnithine racemase